MVEVMRGGVALKKILRSYPYIKIMKEALTITNLRKRD